MIPNEQNRPSILFFFVAASYLVVSTGAKYLHEMGHALVAVLLGLPVSEVTILVNPFGSGHFTSTHSPLLSHGLTSGMVDGAGAVFPIVVLGVVFLANRGASATIRWLASLSFGYALLSNAVNLGSGFATAASDGGHLLFLGFPPGLLMAACLIMAISGASILVWDNFAPLTALAQKAWTRVLVCAGFLVPAILGIALVPLFHDSWRRRLFFGGAEVLLLVCLFGLSQWTARARNSDKTVYLSIPRSVGIVLACGVVLVALACAQYARWIS